MNSAVSPLQARSAIGARRLERSRHSGTDGDHSSPGGAGPTDRLDRRRRHLVPLRVHDVLLELLAAQRLEGARAHVQGHQRRGRSPRAASAAKQRGRQNADWPWAPPRRRERARTGSGSVRDRCASGARVMYGRQRHARRSARRIPSPASGSSTSHKSCCRAISRSGPPALDSSSPGRSGLLARICTSAPRGGSGPLEQQFHAARRRLVAPPGAPAAPACH